VNPSLDLDSFARQRHASPVEKMYRDQFSRIGG
jgi:hypothetical protein